MAVTDKKVLKTANFAKEVVRTALGTLVVSKTDRPYAVIRPDHGFQIVAVRANGLDETGAVTLDAVILGQNGIIKATTVTTHSTPEQLAVAACVIREGGIVYEKAAATGVTFSAAHKITALKHGVILLQITDAGVLSTKVPAATQAYESAALALEALPAPDTGNIALASILIEAGAADWDANTDDLTPASDLVAVTYTSVAAAERVLASAIALADGAVVEGTLDDELTNIRGNSGEDIILLYTTDGTGAIVNGYVDVVYRPYPLNNE